MILITQSRQIYNYLYTFTNNIYLVKNNINFLCKYYFYIIRRLTYLENLAAFFAASLGERLKTVVV
jgi:hypothetical protein